MSKVYHSLAGGNFSQDWSNAGLISVNDDWSGVPSIIGYRGDDLTTATGADPQTITGTSTVEDVNANQTNPNTFNTGGVTEFALADPTIALTGSGTADAPYIVIHLDTTGVADVKLGFNARDLDGSTDNAVQPIAVQYRVGETGSWINLPAGFVADATTGPSEATAVTPVSVELPDAAENQAAVQVRIITANAAGNDEWVGIDDIVVTSTPGGVPQETLSIVANAADQFEGDAGSTAFSFTVTRANGEGEAGADWAVTPGSADAADFAGPLAGTVTFAAGETEQTITIEVAGDTVTEGDEGFTVTLSNPTGGAVLGTATTAGTIRNDDVSLTLISAVQGSGAASTLVGQQVTVEAVVVGDFQDGDADGARNLRGFYLQEEDGDADGDGATSEGVFVFQSSVGLGSVALGDVVRVTGTVGEFFGQTQISASAIQVVGSGAAVTAAEIVLPAAGATLNQDGDWQPDLEAFEGMLVTLPQTLVVTEQFNLDRFNEIKLVAGDRPFQFTHDNAPDQAGYAAFLQELGRRTITYDDGLNVQNAAIGNLDGFGPTYATDNAPRMGDTVTGLSGVLDYQWAGNSGSGATWRVRAAEDGANSFADGSVRPDAPADVGGRLTVGSFNVLNYFATLDNGPNTAIGADPRGADTQAEFDRQTEKLLTAIQGLDADILGLIEIENDFLPGAPGNAIEGLTAALNAAGGSYAYVAPGSQFLGGDAIAVAYIYDTTKVTIAAGTTVEVLDDTDLPGLGLGSLIDDSTVGGVFNGVNTSRAALAVTWEELATGETFTSAVNHFKSKSGVGTGADADALDGQGNWNNQRLLAATALDGWLATNPTGADDADRLIIGDLNAYFREDPIRYLEAAGYENLQLRVSGSYSYVFDGQLGALDQIMANASLAAQVTGITDWHINADEADALDYNLDFGRDAAIFDGTQPWRVSDHDPVLVGLALAGAAPEAMADAVALDEDAASGDLVTLLLGNDAGNALRIVAVGVGGTTGEVDFDEATQTLSYRAAGFDALAAGVVGNDSFTYTVEDGQGDRATATVAVTVTGVNDAPVAGDDNATTREDRAVLVPVLGNDSDIDGGALFVSTLGAALNGTVVLVDGGVLYTPNADFAGIDGFDYTVADGAGGFDTARATIEVEPVPETVSLKLDRREREIEYREDGALEETVAVPRRGALPDLGLPIDLSAITTHGGEADVFVAPGLGIGVSGPGDFLFRNPRVEGSERLVIAIDDQAGFDQAFAAELVVRGAPFSRVWVEAYDGANLVATQSRSAFLGGEFSIKIDPAGAVGFDQLVLRGSGLGFTLRSVTLATDSDVQLG